MNHIKNFNRNNKKFIKRLRRILKNVKIIPPKFYDYRVSHVYCGLYTIKRFIYIDGRLNTIVMYNNHEIYSVEEGINKFTEALHNLPMHFKLKYIYNIRSSKYFVEKISDDIIRNISLFNRFPKTNILLDRMLNDRKYEIIQFYNKTLIQIPVVIRYIPYKLIKIMYDHNTDNIIVKIINWDNNDIRHETNSIIKLL